MNNRIDHVGNVALRKMGNPEGFTVCGWERVDDGVVVITAMKEVATDPDGRRRWIEPEKKVCVTEAEKLTEEARYENETGLCAVCCGSKEEWCGWHHITGNTFRPCKRCDATGKPKVTP